jgi:L-cystine uptake protein TcyP (sodium:dicarboxylate symporter family)
MIKEDNVKGRIFNFFAKILPNKKAMEIEMLGWWIIALVVFVIMIVGFVILKGKGINAIDYIKNIFRFGK